MTLLQTEITVTQGLLSSYTYLGETFEVMKERLHSSEESLKHLQEQVSEVKMQSLKFQRTFSCSDGEENCKLISSILIHNDFDSISTSLACHLL